MKLVQSMVGVGLFASVVLASGAARAACGSGLACEVCDNGFVAPYPMAPPFASKGACTGAELDAFYVACGPSGTTTTCGAFQKAHATCDACLVTANTASTWGMFVCDLNGCAFNTAGCIDVLSDQVKDEHIEGGGGSCGDLLDVSYACQSYACGLCTSSSDFATCVTYATKNECKSYVVPTQSTTGPCANVPTTQDLCSPQTAADWKAMGTLMCGAPPVGDAGDGSPDASASDDAGTTSDASTTTNDAGASTHDDAGTFAAPHGGGCSSSGGEPGTLAWLVAIGAVAARRARRAVGPKDRL